MKPYRAAPYDTKKPAPPRAAVWFFRLIVARCDEEMLLGDLVEEHALLASTLAPRQASRWYWNQVLRSAAPLLGANLRRGGWLKTLGAAFLGYLAMALLVMAGDIAMANLRIGGRQIYALVSLAAGLPAMMLGGYLAAWMRPRAAVALAAISAVMAVVSLAVTGDRAPLWYQIALIVMGPAASLAGGRIRIRGKDRTHI